jgi:hypothetical protein
MNTANIVRTTETHLPFPTPYVHAVTQMAHTSVLLVPPLPRLPRISVPTSPPLPTMATLQTTLPLTCPPGNLHYMSVLLKVLPATTTMALLPIFQPSNRNVLCWAPLPTLPLVATASPLATPPPTGPYHTSVLLVLPPVTTIRTPGPETLCQPTPSVLLGLLLPLTTLPIPLAITCPMGNPSYMSVLLRLLPRVTSPTA